MGKISQNKDFSCTSWYQKKKGEMFFNSCHELVQGFLKEDTFRSTSISSVLNIHRSEDLGSYSDAFSHGFPKQRQRQPSDSALLVKGLSTSQLKTALPHLLLHICQGLSSKLTEEKCPRAGPCQQTAPEGSWPWSSPWCPSLSTSSPALKFGVALAAQSGYKTRGARQTKNM